MTTRSTPFGLFSFVYLGTFAEKTSASLALKKIYKRARPDMEWLLCVIDQICTEPHYFPFLSLYLNPLVFESGGRAFLNYLRKEKADDEIKTVSIRTSFLVKALFEETKEPINVEALQDKIMETFPALEREKVSGVIKQLVKQQFLCFTLLPSLLTDCPFKDFLSKLSSMPMPFPALQDIALKIENYNRTPIGQGEEQLQQLQKSMKDVAEAKNFIQVDTVYKGNNITLSKEIGDELGEAAEILWRLSSVHSNISVLEAYHNKFLEKYGIYRTVPLLELLDGNGGLGIPEVYTKKDLDVPSKILPSSLWKKWLKRQWMLCLRDGLKGKEIEITKEIIDKMLGKGDKAKAMLSFDLFCEVIAKSSFENEKDYLLLISSSSIQGGATLGRFVDLLGLSTKDKLSAFHLEEESLEKDNVFAQSSYISFIPRNANVSIHPNLRRRTINLASPDGIPIDEIFVGSTSERLYLTLKDHQQELIATTGNMLNPMIAPIPIRFIRDVSMSRHQMFSSFPWNDLQEHSFLPRVRFKKAILSAARWKVDLFHLEATKKRL